jgi:hypothetical protein
MKPAPTRPADQPVTLDQVLATLQRIEAKVDALAERQHQPRAQYSAEDAQLVRALFAIGNGVRFSAWEVIDHARFPGAEALRAAILEAIGSENTVKLGKALKRLEGLVLDGLRVVRQGQDRDGALWSIARVRE